DSLKQFMPRFGFAWSPSNSGRRFVVRGHTGIFYAATPLIIMSGHTNNFRATPGNVSISIVPDTTAGNVRTLYDVFQAVGYDLNQGSLGALPIIPLDVVQRAAAFRAGVAAVNPFTGIGIDMVAPDFRNPRSFQAGFGAEGELFGGLIGGVQLNYVNTVNLHRNRDWNLPAPTPRAGDLRPIFARNNRPIPTLGTFTVRESSARSMYRGATLQIQYRRERFQFGTNYTLSETFSDSDLERDAGGSDYENVFDLSRDYNYSRLDARHQFNGWAVANLPLGFEVSSLVRARSGYPLNSTVGADTNGDTLNTDRPYAAPGVVQERNAFRNRPYFNTDLRILKDFRFGEVRRLQFSTEFFNLFNTENVVFNSTGGGTATFFGLGIDPATGQPAAIDPRFRRLRTATGGYDPLTTIQQGNPLQVQFGLRLFF
ncbi:MAG TPA: hypothetical protein VEQ63_15395, partial [Bryobacteraceae bacterium]|nr:hypothetical protein [Bryobacteraceae bacterium]